MTLLLPLLSRLGSKAPLDAAADILVEDALPKQLVYKYHTTHARNVITFYNKRI